MSMRLGCLFGRHEWVPTRDIAPPPCPTGLPVFALKRCRHCRREDFDMDWPQGAPT
jgi:hypothetical protein